MFSYGGDTAKVMEKEIMVKKEMRRWLRLRT